MGEQDRLPSSSIRKYSLLSITGNAIGTAALGLVQGARAAFQEDKQDARGARRVRSGAPGVQGGRRRSRWRGWRERAGPPEPSAAQRPTESGPERSRLVSQDVRSSARTQADPGMQAARVQARPRPKGPDECVRSLLHTTCQKTPALTEVTSPHPRVAVQWPVSPGAGLRRGNRALAQRQCRDRPPRVQSWSVNFVSLAPKAAATQEAGGPRAVTLAAGLEA